MRTTKHYDLTDIMYKRDPEVPGDYMPSALATTHVGLYTTSTTPTNVVDVLVPGNIVGSAPCLLRLTGSMAYSNTSGSNKNLTLEVLIGSQIVYLETITAIPSGAGFRVLHVDLTMTIDATSTAYTHGTVTLGALSTASAGRGSLTAPFAAGAISCDSLVVGSYDTQISLRCTHSAALFSVFLQTEPHAATVALI